MNEPNLRAAGILNVEFGKDVTVVQPVNLYGCKIGDESFVGPFVEIQKGVRIGKRCRIQSHAFICELVEIGDDCFISHGAMFINDLFATGGPAGGKPGFVAVNQDRQSRQHRDKRHHPSRHDLRSCRDRGRRRRDEGYHRTGDLCRQSRAPVAKT